MHPGGAWSLIPDLNGAPVYKEHKALARTILGVSDDSPIDLFEWDRGREALRMARRIIQGGYQKTPAYKPGKIRFTRAESETLLGWATKDRETTYNSNPIKEGSLEDKLWDLWADLHPEEGPFK